MTTALLLAACALDDDVAAGSPGAEETAEVEVATLGPEAALARLSLDLRGVRPTAEELAAIAADPDRFEDYAVAWMDDPRFAERMAWLWNDHLHTAVWGIDYRRFGEWSYPEWRAVSWEPLAFVELVVSEDRPFSEVVTSSYAPRNDTLAAVFDEEGPGTGDTWTWGTYPDDRPMSGILSSRSLWLRYTADYFNYNRQRANAVARVFLCTDFFDREATFSFSLDGGEDAVEAAVATEPSCVSCHAALDPLASFFAGFSLRSTALPTAQYIAYGPFAAEWFALQTPPAYFGTPATDIGDLGPLVAADPRFATCAAQRFYEGLTGHALPDDTDRDALVDAWRAEDLRVRPLIATIVTSDAYLAAEDRVLTTEQLSSALSDLLGLDRGGDLDDDLVGLMWDPELRVMGGGTDDATVLTRNRSVSVGNHVLLQWAGRQVADSFVEAEVARSPENRRLISDPDATDETTVRAALATAAGRFFSAAIEPDAPEVDRLYALWRDAGGDDAPRAGWSVVIQALVRHPRTLTY